MRAKRFSIFTRISILIFALITILGILFMALTYYATTHYHLASTQLLNKDVAAHIAKFASPYDKNGINKKKADSVFKNAMIISPSAEVYFLDTTGNVLDFYGPKKEIKLSQVSLENVNKYIASKGELYIKSPDPRDPSEQKIFSAAEVISNKRKLGYIYVILGSNEYRTVSEILFSSHVSTLAIKALIAIIILSIIFSLLYINRMRKRFNHMIAVLEKFQQGDFNARFQANKNDELAPVTEAFNKMADLLVYNLNEVTRSENERKDFIANISHDLRTPLAVAKGYSETILIKKQKGSIDKEEWGSHIQIILNKISQVEKMVKNLFEISKMESTEFKANKEPFVISEIVQETVNNFQIGAGEKLIKLNCTQCQYHVWINADISMMERVIQNLIENAVKNTPENGTINVALEVETNNLILNIENTGNPLPGELVEWINAPEKNQYQHGRPLKSGLGLVIVKKILDLHGYTLHARVLNNSINQFSFSMPIYTPERIADQS